MYGLVREFLEFFNLEFTAAVLEPEANAVSIGQNLVCFKTLRYDQTFLFSQTDLYSERKELARDLDVIESQSSQQLPLLAEIVRRGGAGQSGLSQHSHHEVKCGNSCIVGCQARLGSINL